MIPLKDNIPTDRFPVLTLVLIALNVLVYIGQSTYETDPQLDQIGYSAVDQSALEYGAIPYRITHPDKDECFIGGVPEAGARTIQAEVVCEGTPDLRESEQAAEQGAAPEPLPLNQAAWWVTLFTSMFMHGGILHLAGNMLFLWIFGNNIEDSMGPVRFILFYLLAGLIAVYAQSLLDTSATVPTIGASGAVAGVLGGYALLHPHARVLSLIFIVFFVTLIEVPAYIVLGIWFVLQFIPAIGQTAIPDIAGEGGVAYWAHLGGFVFGLAAIKLFANRYRDRPVEPPYPVY
ncbi:MAG TPA: rhomboid family intramembrane serine protease [Solirubrobacterales bacterium]|nr:rhomboid family intramembrane serine protease [Solirubrobacterales bacterium]